MCSVKDCADRDRERAMTFFALPALPRTIPAHMAANLLALAVWAHRMSFPAGLFKVFNCLFLGSERVENINDVHANLT